MSNAHARLRPKLNRWQLLAIEVVFLLSLPFLAIVALVATVARNIR
jgi:hypothetical protein